LVETFIDPRQLQDQKARQLRARAMEAYAVLQQGLARLGLPLEIEDTGQRWKSVRLLLLRLQTQSVAAHESLLRFLDEQPIVRRVALPPIVEAENAAGSPAGGPAPIAPPQSNAGSPVLRIIDTGVATLPALEPRCAGRTDLIPGDEQDRS